MELEQKWDAIKDELVEIKQTLVAIQKDLEHHISRTEANEKRIEVAERTFDEVRTILPDIKRMIKYWPYVTGIIMVLVLNKPEILSTVLKLFSGGGLPTP